MEALDVNVKQGRAAESRVRASFWEAVVRKEQTPL